MGIVVQQHWKISSCPLILCGDLYIRALRWEGSISPQSFYEVHEKKGKELEGEIKISLYVGPFPAGYWHIQREFPQGSGMYWCGYCSQAFSSALSTTLTTSIECCTGSPSAQKNRNHSAAPRKAIFCDYYQFLLAWFKRAGFILYYCDFTGCLKQTI